MIFQSRFRLEHFSTQITLIGEHVGEMNVLHVLLEVGPVGRGLATQGAGKGSVRVAVDVGSKVDV